MSCGPNNYGHPSSKMGCRSKATLRSLLSHRLRKTLNTSLLFTQLMSGITEPLKSLASLTPDQMGSYTPDLHCQGRDSKDAPTKQPNVADCPHCKQIGCVDPALSRDDAGEFERRFHLRCVTRRSCMHLLSGKHRYGHGLLVIAFEAFGNAQAESFGQTCKHYYII